MTTQKVEAKNREYIRPMPANWWRHNRYLVQFMIRELTAVFVGGYALFLLVMLCHFKQGTESFHLFFVHTLLSPWVILLQLVALAFVVYHAITTWNAAPVLMVIWRGDEKVDPKLIIRANYAAWLVVTLIVVVIAFVWR